MMSLKFASASSIWRRCYGIRLILQAEASLLADRDLRSNLRSSAAIKLFAGRSAEGTASRSSRVDVTPQQLLLRQHARLQAGDPAKPGYSFLGATEKEERKQTSSDQSDDGRQYPPEALAVLMTAATTCRLAF